MSEIEEVSESVETYTIYGLAEKTVSGGRGPIRYIGLTKRGLEYAVHHVRSSAKGATTELGVRAWVNSVGLHNFVGEVLEEVTGSLEDGNDRLAFWLDYAEANGLDLVRATDEERAAATSKGAEGKFRGHMTGKTHTPEARAKISAGNMGHELSDEHKAQISAIHKGKVVSAETRAKIAAKAMGHKRNAGRVQSPETRFKMSFTKHIRGHVDKGLVKEGCRHCEAM